MEAPQAEKGTIAICFVEEALVCAAPRGLDRLQLLKAAGISRELLDRPGARISSRQYGELWHHIARAIDDEFFGMDRHPMKAGSFTLLCHAIIHSDTLERALRRALRFLRVVLDELAGELTVEGELAHLRLRDLPAAPGDDPPVPKRAFAYGTYLLMLHGLACWLIGRRIPVHQADFRCPEPPYSNEWRVLFSRTLHFGQPGTGISFPAEFLAMPNVQNEASMKQFLRAAPANFLVKYKNSTGLAARIRRRLRNLPPPEWPDFATLAHQLNLSPATLRRRLDDEGQSYRGIMDDLRRDLAISLLNETSQSILSIASELGFAETSAFHRAFKKWTGVRPGEYRER